MIHHSGRLSLQAVKLSGLFLYLSSLSVFGQLSKPGRPYPVEYNGSPELIVYEILVAETYKTKALATDSQSMLKPAKSGFLVDVDFSTENSGTWDTIPDGTKIWRAAFHVEGASMMNVVFSPYQLNQGVKVFLFDSQQKSILGAFTYLNNKQFNVLATAHIPGDILIVEIQVPVYMPSLGTLSISEIGCDFSYQGTGKTLKDGWYGKSGSCNSDINCFGDSLVQLLKNSVVRIVFSGGERCTGTLVNNTRQDGIAYLLTAEHCISKETVANASVFHFDYESPYCGGPDGNSQKTISGATIRATNEHLDFTLLELLEPLPFDYQPYYAGWDYSGNLPLSGFIIHHPLGDVKKISREEHSLTVANFGQGYDDNTHWLVGHWETGTTEAGSSGGPFFDQFGRIVGTLTGGLANCTSPLKDYFQMISHSWDDYSSSENQLAYWLDPLELQHGYLNGFDPFSEFKSTGDTLTNFRPDDALTIESGAMSWGSYSGHNSLFLTGFAERFSVTANKNMLGLLLHVASNYVAGTASSVTIKVWNGNDVPDKVVFEKSIPMAELTADVMNFIEFDSVIAVAGTFFAGYELEYNAPQDTFSVYMAENRISDPFHTAYVNDGSQWQSLLEYTGGNLNSSFAVMPLIFDSIPQHSAIPKFEDVVTAYPNPAVSTIWLEFREISVLPVQITLMNIQGQALLERSYGPYQHLIRLEIPHFGNGIYIIRVKIGNLVQNLKIAIVK